MEHAERVIQCPEWMKNCQEIMQKLVQTTAQILVSVCSKVNAKLDSDIKSFDGLYVNHVFCF